MKENSRIIEQKKFEQFVLSRQWETLKNYTHSKHIKIIGDLPIFVSYDSADVWTNPKLFKLTNNLASQVIAGVPPDYFSPTGQLWGNPLYRWEVHKRTQYKWWIKRFQHSLKMADIIRLDHFRGFAGFWEVPSSSPTAEGGYWVKGPGIPFFNEIQKTLGSLPFIAEDLGLISEDVVELRDHFKLPGMKILQFAFNKDSLNQYLPHNFPVDCVVFTGTHDNETIKGWFIALPKKEREFCLQYLNSNGEHIAWDMIRVAWSSVAVFALAPMQDFLELGSEARMNYPGHVGGNWTWRISKKSLKSALIKKIKKINQLYDRNNVPLEEKVELPKINYLNS
jgi:4-alpha-glucanotransferase